MEISDEQLIKFQALYKKHFGKEISREEAYEQGCSLVRLVEAIYRPVTKTDLERINKIRDEKQ